MGLKIHFVGCEGVSMKTLMALCRANGFETSGSDLTLGGHDAKNVEGADTVVYTAAIAADNPEIIHAKELGIPLMKRSELLGEILSDYDFSVAVAGTHGKTTTTGMLWETTLSLDPTIHIGGTYNKKTGRIGGKGLFITEACEYQRSFLSLYPDIAVILNVDLDHTDCYKNLEDIRSSFFDFASQAKTCVINGDELDKAQFESLPDKNPASKKQLGHAKKKVISVGLNKECDYYATCISCDKCARFSFCVYKQNVRLGRVTLSVAGRHNIINALFTIAVCDELGLSFGRICDGLFRFTGAERRMEFLGYREGCAVFSDYAHHPKEIATTLLSAKESRYKHITAVFEPHTYTRTKSFCAEFADVLSKADSVVLLPVYPAREKAIEGVSSQIIADELLKLGVKTAVLDSYSLCADFLNDNIKDDGVILFMGAGSIDKLARDFLKR